MLEGATEMLLPVPTSVPVPLGPVYHWIAEPVPVVPPLAVNTRVVLGQRVPVMGAMVGAVDGVLTITFWLVLAVQPLASVTVTL